FAASRCPLFLEALHARHPRRPRSPDDSDCRLGIAGNATRELHARSRRHYRGRARGRIHRHQARSRRRQSRDVQHQSHLRERTVLLTRNAHPVSSGLLEPHDRSARPRPDPAPRRFLVPQPAAPGPWRGHRASVRPNVTAAQAAIFAYAILSRMAYVLFVGAALRRRDRSGVLTEPHERAEAFRRFRRTAGVIMYHDAFAFVVLCLATRDTWQLALPTVITMSVGAL